MLVADELNIESADLMRHDLAIVAYVDHFFEHGRDGDDVVDPDAVPLSFSVPQTILTSGVTGMLHSILTPSGCVDREFIYAYSVCCVLICRRFRCLYSLHYGGSFLFRATPRLNVIPAGGFNILASHNTSDAPSVAGFPIASEVLMPEEVSV